MHRITSLACAALALAAATISLAACDLTSGGSHPVQAAISVATGSVTKDQVDVIKSGYTAGFLAWASGYGDLYDANPCPAGGHATLSNLCAEYPVLLKLQQTHAIIDGELKDAYAGVADCAKTPKGPMCGGLVANYNKLSQAWSDAKALGRVYGYGG